MASMLDLFKVAGYEDYSNMNIGVGYAPKNRLEILSWDKKTKKTVYKEVELLYFKGMSKGYEITIPSTGKRFLCTGAHRFMTKFGRWSRAKQLAKFGKFKGFDENGTVVDILIKPSEEEFPVLDMQVKDTQCYFSAGVLSHNTFGGTAKLFANGLKYINPYLSKFNTSMIVINQERANIGGYGADFSTTGGYAIKYYSSWRGRITRIDDIKDAGSMVGIISRVRNTKNKIGIPKRDAELELRFATGFDSENEYLKFIVDLGIVEKRGAWFYQEDWGFKGNGRDSILEFLKKSPELFTSVKNTVNAMLSGETILDTEREQNDEAEDSPEEIKEELL